ncbi:FecR domain-containing protein [Puniceicoccaceae bacterium K14]|nr:FecR domain-containing protein [Puniceicoccaceae bacterium K14]
MENDSEEELSRNEQEAIAWAARRANASEWNASDEKAFRYWLEASPTNVEAYQNAQRTLEIMSEPKLFKSGEILQLKGLAQYPSQTNKPHRYWIPSLLSIAAAIVLIVFLRPNTNHSFQTAVAERQQFTLPDGTTVELDAQSKIEYDFNDKKREVKLLAGAAVFDIAADERPFQARALDLVINDIGTIFSVRLRSNLGESYGSASAVEVAVAEGIVDVLSKENSQESPVRLTEGQQTVFAGGDPAPLIQDLRSNAFATWRESRLRYHGSPLGEVLGDLQRNYTGKIVLTDPSLAKLEVTGTLRINKLRETISLLEDILPIHVREFSAERLIIDKRL